MGSASHAAFCLRPAWLRMVVGGEWRAARRRLRRVHVRSQQGRTSIASCVARFYAVSHLVTWRAGMSSASHSQSRAVRMFRWRQPRQPKQSRQSRQSKYPMRVAAPLSNPPGSSGVPLSVARDFPSSGHGGPCRMIQIAPITRVASAQVRRSRCPAPVRRAHAPHFPGVRGSSARYACPACPACGPPSRAAPASDTHRRCVARR